MSYTKRHVRRLKSAGHKDPEKARQRASAPKPALTPDYAASRDRKIAAEAELAELKLAEQKGKLVEVDRVLKAINENGARMRSMFDAAFRSELPAKQGGLPADQIAAMNAERLDEIYKELGRV